MRLLPAAALCLLCSDEPVVKPVVSVYPAASRAHMKGRSALLCVASAMFPPVVRFSWRRRREDGTVEELPLAEGEQLELRESGRTVTIRLLDQDDLQKYKYRCYVQHEGGMVEAGTEQEFPAPLAVSCPPERYQAQSEEGSWQPQFRVKLLCLLSTLMIVKSLLFCCGLSLQMILTNKQPSTNFTHSD